MRLQQFIKELTELEKIYGDLPINFEDYDGATPFYWPIGQIELSSDKKAVILK